MQVQYTLAFAGVRIKHKKKVYGIIIIYVSHRVYSEKKHLFFIIMEISRVKNAQIGKKQSNMHKN